MKQFIHCLASSKYFLPHIYIFPLSAKKRWTDVLNFEKEERRMLTSLKIVL